VAASPAAVPVWSSADEAALQALLARRRAAGYQRRGRNIGGQLVRLGGVSPNPGTVTAAIVAGLTRDQLVEAMASAEFKQAKAKPTDKAWCQGYVAGAIRSGFLIAADAS
jgi:hypothetical protein